MANSHCQFTSGKANLKTRWSTCQWIEAAFQKLPCALRCSNRELLQNDRQYLFYLQSDAFNCLAWFSLDLELILFDYLKYFGTELKNVQCQLVFVWGGAEAQSGHGGGGREIYEKSLHHSDSNADYRDQYCTNMLFAQANIFAVPRSHFKIIDSS